MSGGTMRKNREQEDQKMAADFGDVSVDQTQIRPQGYILGDGYLRMSFMLPIPLGNKTRAVARRLAETMGLKNVRVTHIEAVDHTKSFCVVEAQSESSVDATAILPEVNDPVPSDVESLCRFVKERLNRRLIVAGGCLGPESDSVVMDTLFNMAGYMGKPGIEAYPCFSARHLRADLDPQALVHKLVDVQADAIVVCKVAGKNDDVVAELTRFVRLLDDDEALPDHLVKICVSPRMTTEVAEDMGYDAGFGAGTLPLQLAQFIVQTVMERV